MAAKLHEERLSEDELWERFGTLEHARLEFKESAGSGKNRQDPFVALANTEGGHVLIGVADSRQIMGCSNLQQTLDDLADIFHAISWQVEPLIRVLRVGSMRVISAEIPAQLGGIATTSDGRVIVRRGSRNRALVGEQVVTFVSARKSTSSEELPVSGVPPVGISIEAVAEYLRARGTPRDVSPQEVLPLLESMGFATPDGLKAAGVALFAIDPATHLPGCRVTFVRIPGVKPEVVYEKRFEISAPASTLIRKIWDAVFLDMRREAIVRGLLRTEIPEYPPAAVREAIVNAVAHRDYGLKGAETFVRMYDDRIEIQSPGSLPAGITVENIQNEQFSRNPRLMEALLALGFVERLGEGMNLIFREMEGHLLSKPELNNTEQSFTITLRNQSLLSLDDRVWLQQLNQQMSVEQQLALVRARHDGSVTNKALREVAHLSRDESRGALRDLSDLGLLEVEGQRGGTRYVLAGQAAVTAATPVVSRQAQFRALVEYVRVNGRITNREARKALSEDDAGVVRALLRSLVQEGVIVKQGKAKGSWYEPSPKSR